MHHYSEITYYIVLMRDSQGKSNSDIGLLKTLNVNHVWHRTWRPLLYPRESVITLSLTDASLVFCTWIYLQYCRIPNESTVPVNNPLLLGTTTLWEQRSPFFHWLQCCLAKEKQPVYCTSSRQQEEQHSLMIMMHLITVDSNEKRLHWASLQVVLQQLKANIQAA